MCDNSLFVRYVYSGDHNFKPNWEIICRNRERMPPRRNTRNTPVVEEPSDNTPIQRSAQATPELNTANSIGVMSIGGFMQAFQECVQTMRNQTQGERLDLSNLEKFLKLTPLSFKGETNPEIAEAWISEVEKKFKVMKCPEEDKVNLATYMLQDRADVWWKAALRTTFVGRESEVSWKEFLNLFEEKYFPEHIRDAKEREFLSLVQGNLSVGEYEAKFSELGKYAPHIYNDEHRRIRKFVDGLKSSIRRFVAIQDPSTFALALRSAHLVEQENNRYF